MYEYRAIVTKVYDGDTVTLDIDLGLGVWVRDKSVRLAGIDAPEVRGPEREVGLDARDALKDLILNKEVKIKTYKDKKGKYGRYIVDIYLDDVFVNGWLVHNDWAEIY